MFECRWRNAILGVRISGRLLLCVNSRARRRCLCDLCAECLWRRSNRGAIEQASERASGTRAIVAISCLDTCNRVFIRQLRFELQLLRVWRSTTAKPSVASSSSPTALSETSATCIRSRFAHQWYAEAWPILHFSIDFVLSTLVLAATVYDFKIGGQPRRAFFHVVHTIFSQNTFLEAQAAIC